MTNGQEHENQDWLLPAALIVAALGLIAISVGAFLALKAESADDGSLSGQMETWTRCLRSEGVPVPLVESLDGDGFRLTFDDVVINADVGFEQIKIGFELCRESAPDGIKKLADIAEGLSDLQFGDADLGGLGGLLFGIDDQHESEDRRGRVSPFGNPDFHELCERLDDLERIRPGVAKELLYLCLSGADV